MSAADDLARLLAGEVPEVTGTTPRALLDLALDAEGAGFWSERLAFRMNSDVFSDLHDDTETVYDIPGMLGEAAALLTEGTVDVEARDDDGTVVSFRITRKGDDWSWRAVIV